MIRRPLSSLKLKQTDIEEMDANMVFFFNLKVEKKIFFLNSSLVFKNQKKAQQQVEQQVK